MNPWISNFLLLAISGHISRVGALKARQWACPRFISVVCGLSIVFCFFFYHWRFQSCTFFLHPPPFFCNWKGTHGVVRDVERAEHDKAGEAAADAGVHVEGGVPEAGRRPEGVALVPLLGREPLAAEAPRGGTVQMRRTAARRAQQVRPSLFYSNETKTRQIFFFFKLWKDLASFFQTRKTILCFIH
jgi:hypothetical protein